MGLFKNKRGIELSINFIVLLILGIAMFSGGLVFVGKFFSKAGTMKGALDSQTERQIEAMLDSGSAFVIPIHTKTVARSKLATFGVGLYNDGRDKVNTQFGVELVFNSAFSKTNEPLCQANSCSTEAMPKFKPSLAQTATIQPGTKQKFLYLVEIPPKTKSGSYIYTLSSTQGTVEYEPSLQLIVKVK